MRTPAHSRWITSVQQCQGKTDDIIRNSVSGGWGDENGRSFCLVCVLQCVCVFVRACVHVWVEGFTPTVFLWVWFRVCRSVDWHRLWLICFSAVTLRSGSLFPPNSPSSPNPPTPMSTSHTNVLHPHPHLLLPPFHFLPFIQSILTFNLLTQEAGSSDLVSLVPLARNRDRASSNCVCTKKEEVSGEKQNGDDDKTWNNHTFYCRSQFGNQWKHMFFPQFIYLWLFEKNSNQSKLFKIFDKSGREVRYSPVLAVELNKTHRIKQEATTWK